jgi:WD40 repeat protein/tRNA A-37 threonylcarbamoyl transferase component Bud32
MTSDRFSSEQQATRPVDVDSSRLSGASEMFGIGSAPDPIQASRPDPLVGADLDGVTVVRLIAEGGMGRVYEGWQDQPGRPVAVKVMRDGIASGSLLKRFDYEARILGRLRHPGIAQIHTVGIHEAAGVREPFFVMEFIPHAASITAYAESRDLSAAERLELFRQVCLAVAHGHQRGVIHRDLKPSNILVDAGGQPKVIDFGIARSTDADMALTSLHTDVGQLIGTLQYMSPEQFDADPDEIDVRSDVYALGVVLYELLTGQPPYELKQKPVYEAARVVREATPTPLSAVNRTLRRDVSIIAGKCLEKDRTRRYASAGELGADIGRYLAGDPILAAPPSFSDSLRRLARRHRAAVAALAGTFVALAMAVAGISFFYLRAEQQKQQAIVDRNRAVEKETEAQTQAAEANRQRQRAEAETARANDRVYVGNLYRASDKVAEHNFDKARSLLMENRGLAEGAGNPIELRVLEARLDRAYAVLRGHVGGVGSVTFSPDGSRVLTRGADATLRTWNADTGELISSRGEFPTAVGAFPLPRPPFQAGLGLPAAAGRSPAPTRFGGRLPIMPASGIVRRVASADGTRSVTFSRDGIVRLWNPQTKEKLASWKPPGSAGGGAAAINLLAVNRDASRVAVVCRDRRLLLWNPLAGDVAEASGHFDDIRAMIFSPDGTLLATGSVDRTARLWDATTGAAFAVFDGHSNGVSNVVFSPDGKRLATASGGSFDSTARLFDVVRGGELHTLAGHTDKIVAIRFTPDGGRVVTAAADRTARIWNVSTAREVALLAGHEGPLTGLVITPDGGRIATCSADGTARLWEGSGGRQLLVLKGHEKSVTSLAVSVDGRLLVTGSDDTTGRLWDLTTGEVRAVLRGHTSGITSVAFSPDGRRCATGSSDRTARIWDTETAASIAVLQGHSTGITAVCFSPDGSRLATAASGVWQTSSDSGRIWDVATATEIAALPCDGGTVHDISFSPDGSRLASAYFSSSVCLWNAITGREKKGLLGHSDSVYRLAFSPDGRRLVTGAADHTVRVWDVARGEELAVLRGHTNHVMAVTFSPDGSRLATASDDHTARIWGLSNAEIHHARIVADTAALNSANAESQPPAPAPPP